MQSKLLAWIKGRPKAARLAAWFCYCAGAAAIVGWSLPSARTAVAVDAPSVRQPEAGPAEPTDAHQAPGRTSGNARAKSYCRGCGVIESVRQIDRREEIAGECAAGKYLTTRIPGIGNDDGERAAAPGIAGAVDGAIRGDRRGKSVRVTTTHQIVVRFRDGSRHVFNEETPRSLHEGDRVQVIVGAAGAAG
jgi:outer membrane lipoprotein SlyB